MSDSDEERALGVQLSRRAVNNTSRKRRRQYVAQNAVDATPRAPRRKEVPRDFLKGKIEKFTMKLERAKSAGNEEDITKYTAKVKKFQDQFDALPPEKMEPYELPEGTTDDDACSVAAEMRPLLRVLVGESARRARAPATRAA